MLQSSISIHRVGIQSSPCVRRITFMRWQGANYILTGEIIGEQQVALKRWPGVVVTEYRVKPDKDQTNLTALWVDESDVLGIVENEPCPRCQDRGHIAVVDGDNDVPCEVCGFVDTDEVF